MVLVGHTLICASVFGDLRPATPALFPYTTLFRSGRGAAGRRAAVAGFGGRPRRRRRGGGRRAATTSWARSEEHTSELQSRQYLVCPLLLEQQQTIWSTLRTSSSVRAEPALAPTGG